MVMALVSADVGCSERDRVEVASAADRLGLSGLTEQECAVAVFGFVRDAVLHAWGPQQSVSQTLTLLRGDCWAKAALQVALLRHRSIPARFHWFEYRKCLFEGLVPDAVYAGLADPFPFHVAAEVQLAGRWLIADASFDRYLRPERAVAWDGRGHARCLRPHEVVRDLGWTTTFEQRRPDIDAFFAALPATTPEQDRAEAQAVNRAFQARRRRQAAGRASNGRCSGGSS